MRWLRRFFRIPEQTIRLVIDGEPMGDVTVDSLTALAAVFRNTPGLQASLMADFCDTMTNMEGLAGTAHEERIRLAQKACDLWRFLRIPHSATSQANALIEAQRQERAETHKAPEGARTVM